MRKNTALIAAITAIALICSGCSADRKKEKNAVSFINAFYTISFYDRAVDPLMAATGKSVEDVDSEKVSNRFQQYFTEEAFAEFSESKQWLNILDYVDVNGYLYTPEEIQLEKTEDGSYKYSLTVVVTDFVGSTPKKVSQSGSLKMTDDGKIESFDFDNAEQLQYCVL